MENNLPFVSVIIPCRNEEKFIGKCLNSILEQDFPKEKLEVLIIDGSSEDKTKEIVKEYIKKYSFLKILDNSQKFTPFGLNIGIKEARGEIIIRMDSHAGYEKDYISKCVKYLQEYEADNVGGIIKTLPAVNNPEAKAISLALSNFFGAASVFRKGANNAREVDTVFGGCYKKEVFLKIGLFNEKLIRSQDFEFNLRLRKRGGKILLFPDIVAYYYPSSDLHHFAKHNFSDGFWVTYPLKFGIKYFSLRHLLPLFFSFSLIMGFIFGIFLFWVRLFFVLLFSFYLVLSLIISFKISIKNGIKYLPFLIISFFTRHFFYGLGSIWGLIRAIFN